MTDEKVLAAIEEALRPLGAYLDTPEEEFAQLLHDAGWTLVRRDGVSSRTSHTERGAQAITEPDQS